MTNKTNPELPAEVVEEIEQFVEDKTKAEREHWNKAASDPDRTNTYMAGYEYGIRAGATSYATKWFYSFEGNGKLAATVADNLDVIKVLEYDNTRLKGEVDGYREACEELKNENEKLKEQATSWRPLLEEAIRQDSLYGHVPVETINKIKRFLYGE